MGDNPRAENERPAIATVADNEFNRKPIDRSNPLNPATPTPYAMRMSMTVENGAVLPVESARCSCLLSVCVALVDAGSHAGQGVDGARAEPVVRALQGECVSVVNDAVAGREPRAQRMRCAAPEALRAETSRSSTAAR